MINHFLTLEWKSFFRSASFGSNLFVKIIMAIAALYFIALFFAMGGLSYYFLKDFGLNPLVTVNKFLIYYFVGDLTFRYLLQKMPTMNIVPLMILPIKRKDIVHYTLGKTAISFFNIIHAFFFIPFSVAMLFNGHSASHVILWHLSMMGLIFANNYINILINNKDMIFYPVVAAVVGCGIAQYYHIFDVTDYTFVFFDGLYHTSYLFLLPIILVFSAYYFSFNFFKNHLNLDEGLARKSEVAKTENLNWLNQFGTLGTFLKNDLRMIRRNKRPRATVVSSFFFIFYGLLFFSGGIETYNNPTMQIFGAIFVSGGFLLNFGQFVPSWDSAYYQLMMSQNISYREYLNSKWWLMVIATVVSAIVASFYLYFGWKVYLLILVGAIYNIGVNAHLVLLGGAFVKTPVDLSAGKKAFGDKQAFNFKVLLISLPKLLLPMLLYGIGYFIYSHEIGCLFIAIAGILGFASRNYVFSKIEKIYKTEKYATIAAYKQSA